ncbi:MAG: tetratricopeptide repeat protein, partial [Acidobacteria bacterium]|nr:tetratricopeptide repeat protein [Acidobacteriota bacterium]
SQQLPISEREPNLQAIQMLRQALALDPNFAVGQARMAYRTHFLSSYDDAKNLDLAIKLARKAITLDPTLSDGHFVLASVYSQKGQVADARVSFLRGMGLSPSQPEPMLDLSILEGELGRYDEALLWARRGFPLMRNSSSAYYFVALPLVALGEDAVAEQWLAKAEQRFPDSARIKIVQAMLAYERGNDREADALARKLVESDPKNEESLPLLAELTFLLGGWDAEERAERFFRVSPDITAAWWLVTHSPRVRYAALLAGRGHSSRAKQLLEEALRLAEKALADGNQSPRVPLEMAAIHALRSENDAALHWMQRGYEAGWRGFQVLARDPMFANVRKEARFQLLLKRMEADVAEMRRRANTHEVLQLLPTAAAPPK